MAKRKYDPLDATREDVLNSFAIEEEMTSETLKRYQMQWPWWGADLIELYHELIKPEPECRELTPEEQAEEDAWVKAAWERHIAARPKREQEAQPHE